MYLISRLLNDLLALSSMIVGLNAIHDNRKGILFPTCTYNDPSYCSGIPISTLILKYCHEVRLLLEICNSSNPKSSTQQFKP